VAIDTEADSLHHYPGKLCLVQIADARGRGHLVDPLALRDLSLLGPVLADPGTLKVLHAADNDLAYLKRLYGVTVVSLFDTAVAARFIGATSLGLEGLLSQYLGVTAVKSRQKDDWSRRPLTPEQEAHALTTCSISSRSGSGWWKPSTRSGGRSGWRRNARGSPRWSSRRSRPTPTPT
jgi:ribonuclease D